MARLDARVGRAILAAGWLALGAVPSTTPSSQGRDEAPGRAVAFLRIIGDVEIVPGRDLAPIGDTRIVRSNVEVATGSGFLFSSVGQVLTCLHVVSDSDRTAVLDGKKVQVRVKVRRIEVVLRPGGPESDGGLPDRYEATVIASSPDLDLAVLSINGGNFPSLDLGDSDALETGDALDVIGFPFGQDVEIARTVPEFATAPDPSVSRGNFSAFRTDAQGQRRYLQTTATVNPGSSGGPIVDSDGYVVGIVSRRLTGAGGAGTGVGFAVPINLVKEFLETRGLDGALPARRQALGPLQSLESKALRVRLPWGMADTSPLRARVDTGGTAAAPTLRIDRVVSPWDVTRLADAVVGGEALEAVIPAAQPVQRFRPAAGRRTLVGRVTGALPDGTAARVEYAVVDLGPEKILARYVGPPNQMAYNASVFRASLASIEADLLRRDTGPPPRPGTWTPATIVGPSSPLVPLVVPAGWVQEPQGPMPCGGLRGPAEAVAASPVADFTRTVRAAVVRQPGLSVSEAVAACGTPVDGEPGGYERQVVLFGTRFFLHGRFVATERGELLQFEAAAPVEHRATVRDLFTLWMGRTEW